METWVRPIGYDIVSSFCSLVHDFTFICSLTFWNHTLLGLMTLMAKCHRIAKLGLDRNFGEEEELRLSAYARVRVADPSNSGEANSKVRG
ncbi:hypothetical protein ACFX1T_005916 [Malus domestica]